MDVDTCRELCVQKGCMHMHVWGPSGFPQTHVKGVKKKKPCMRVPPVAVSSLPSSSFDTCKQQREGKEDHARGGWEACWSAGQAATCVTVQARRLGWPWPGSRARTPARRRAARTMGEVDRHCRTARVQGWGDIGGRRASRLATPGL